MKPLKEKVFSPQLADCGSDLAYPVIASNCKLLFRVRVITISFFVICISFSVPEFSAWATSLKNMLGSKNACKVEQQNCFDELLLILSQSVEQYTIELKSDEFDTLLAVISPNGEIFSNCNYQGSANRSLIKLPHNSEGDWTVVVTSSNFTTTGDYELRVVPDAKLTKKDKKTLKSEQLKEAHQLECSS